MHIGGFHVDKQDNLWYNLNNYRTQISVDFKVTNKFPKMGGCNWPDKLKLN